MEAATRLYLKHTLTKKNPQPHNVWFSRRDEEQIVAMRSVLLLLLKLVVILVCVQRGEGRRLRSLIGKCWVVTYDLLADYYFFTAFQDCVFLS